MGMIDTLLEKLQGVLSSQIDKSLTKAQIALSEMGPEMREHIAEGIRLGAGRAKADAWDDILRMAGKAKTYAGSNLGRFGRLAGLAGLGLFGAAHLGAAGPAYLAGRVDADPAYGTLPKPQILKSLLIPGYYAYERGLRT